MTEEKFELKTPENTVSFKSTTFFIEKECVSNVKNNTVREIDLNDERFTKLLNRQAKFLDLQDPNESRAYFKKITDISVWKGLVIISFRSATHKEVGWEK